MSKNHQQVTVSCVVTVPTEGLLAQDPLAEPGHSDFSWTLSSRPALGPGHPSWQRQQGREGNRGPAGSLRF